MSLHPDQLGRFIFVTRMTPTDEFEIRAIGQSPNRERIWTRGNYDVAKFIADSAITKLGYTRAEVVNTFGGHRSDVLYEVTATHSRDFVIEERMAKRSGL